MEKVTILPRSKSRAELIGEAEDLFKKIDEWFFGNDTTHFDPSYLEHLEEVFKIKGYLTAKQLEDLRTIYDTWVCN
jgi:hypothetical protein